jgi:hypothetical protein
VSDVSGQSHGKPQTIVSGIGASNLNEWLDAVAQKAEAGGLQVQSQTGQHSDTKTQKNF